MSAIRIALTGGPCGGKTTVLEAVRKEFGEQVLAAPEVASMLLGNGFPRPGEFTQSKFETYADYLQNSILPVQSNMEQAFGLMAEERIGRVILFDRGLLDVSAYLGKGRDFFLDRFDLNLNEVFARYDAVLHLGTIASSDEATYERLKSTNPARYETAAEARARDLSIIEAWQGHPNHVVIPSGSGIKEVVRRVIEVISGYISNEIEAKYLFPSMPDIPLGAGVTVVQGYFATQGEMRIRRMGDQGYLTIKGDGTHSRGECERSIDLWAFDQQWPDTEGRRIEKTRHFIPYQGLTLELDVYHGPLQGLVTMECEFPNEDDLQAFTLPEWASHALDITEDKRYKNKNLALNGLPKD